MKPLKKKSKFLLATVNKRSKAIWNEITIKKPCPILVCLKTSKDNFQMNIMNINQSVSFLMTRFLVM